MNYGDEHLFGERKSNFRRKKSFSRNNWGRRNVGDRRWDGRKNLVLAFDLPRGVVLELNRLREHFLGRKFFYGKYFDDTHLHIGNVEGLDFNSYLDLKKKIREVFLKEVGCSLGGWGFGLSKFKKGVLRVDVSGGDLWRFGRDISGMGVNVNEKKDLFFASLDSGVTERVREQVEAVNIKNIDFGVRRVLFLEKGRGRNGSFAKEVGRVWV